MTLPRLALCALLGLIGAAGSARSQAPIRRAAPIPTPALGELNPHVLAVLRSYPMDGTHRYYWPRKGGWGGNTCDLRYGGKLFAKGDPKKRCYCCGLTFEVFLRAWERWCRQRKLPFAIPGILGIAELKNLQVQWFGSDGDRRTLLHALVAHKIGTHIEHLEDARPGDFVQFWRRSGSGHSVIFIAWVRTGERITGLCYWSTQGATAGIGYRVEDFSGKKGILRDQIYIARVGRKRT